MGAGIIGETRKEDRVAAMAVGIMGVPIGQGSKGVEPMAAGNLLDAEEEGEEEEEEEEGEAVDLVHREVAVPTGKKMKLMRKIKIALIIPKLITFQQIITTICSI